MTPVKPALEDINAAIDHASRRMTSAPLPTDLRARVMTRVDARQPRTWWRWTVAGSAVAAVALAVTVTWRPRDVPVARGPQANPTAAPIISSPLLSMAATRSVLARRAVVAVSAAEMEWWARSVPALKQPDALQVEPLGHSRIGIDPIDITPLYVTPLVVPALGDGQDK